MQSWKVGLLWSRKGDPWIPNPRHVVYAHQAFSFDNICCALYILHHKRITRVPFFVDVTDMIVVRVVWAPNILLGALKPQPLSAPTRRSSHCIFTDTGAYFVPSDAQPLTTQYPALIP
jgi:hypothetical protein